MIWTLVAGVPCSLLIFVSLVYLVKGLITIDPDYAFSVVISWSVGWLFGTIAILSFLKSNYPEAFTNIY